MQRLIVAALSLFLTIPTAVSAQTADLEFESLVEVSEVLLDVMVTDRDGNVVKGLTKDDFIVKEDGEVVPVTGLAYYATEYGDGGLAEGEIPWSRFFIAFFHDQSRVGSIGTRLMRRQMEAGRSLTEWVNKEMLPSDWLAVVSYDVRLNIHADFTQDREALAEAIKNATLSRRPDELSPSEREKRIAAGPSLYRNLPAGPDLGKASKRIYDAMRLVADASGYIVGRKNLLYFTVIFDNIDDFNNRPDPRFYPEMEQALNHHNVAVYPIDLTPPEFELQVDAILNRISLDTGGYYHYNFVNFITPIRQISQENQGFYLLSYQTEYPAGESGYRTIKINTVKDAADTKLRVRTRRGYRYGFEAD